MMAGLPTRRYEKALEPVGSEGTKKASSTSRSSVSRRFVAATAERLAEFRSRPLDDAKWPSPASSPGSRSRSRLSDSRIGGRARPSIIRRAW